MKRYEMRWATLDLVVGSEMAEQRPVVIVSRDELNARLETITVCPITSQLHPTWRTRLSIRVSRKPAEIAVDHIRAVSRARLGNRLGKLSSTEAASLRRLIVGMYGAE